MSDIWQKGVKYRIFGFTSHWKRRQAENNKTSTSILQWSENFFEFFHFSDLLYLQEILS